MAVSRPHTLPTDDPGSGRTLVARNLYENRDYGYPTRMKTLETDMEIAADGSMRVLSPLPEWLKPGRVHVVLTLTDDTEGKPKRQIPTASPEMIARRMAALDKVRALDPYREISDPVEWQRTVREDVIQPGRD